jgi:hypothetical protein
MIILTLKERQFIEDAVMRFGDDRERRIWQQWKLDHDTVRFDQDGPQDDGTGGMPSNVGNVIVNTLTCLDRHLQTRIESVEMSDDDAADLCNDVAEIRSTVEAIRTA